MRFIKDRLDVVYSANNPNVYDVRFDVQNGGKLGECECKAAMRGLVCYHIIAGATTNIYRPGESHQAKYFCIIFVRMNRIPLKQTLAALLSISFLWTFAACVLICGDSACAEESSKISGFSVGNHEPNRDACPITETPKSATAERIAIDSFSFTAASWRQVFVFKPKINRAILDLPRQIFVFGSPPLKRLPVLRI